MNGKLTQQKTTTFLTITAANTPPAANDWYSRNMLSRSISAVAIAQDFWE
jgi:hypothetical protein